ncbi:efflux RND transporter periplasmic adaptor subunit [Saccharicrinis sp. FJH62]|uniref:efflux RND transporter periplasmic adaptor subunit n=1 Tax=Saccharicrinis sp. FJH62 TaxID=3344657 RepID=UPI0035D3DD2D
MVRRSTLSNAAVSLFMAVFFLSFASCGHKSETRDGYLKLVKTARAVEISADRQEQFPGVIEELDQVNLAFRVAGPIKKIYVKEGDFVEKDQLVAEMDTRDYEIQKNAIETQVKQLRSEYDRIAELRKRGSVSENDYEKMKAGKEMAEVKLKNAYDQLKDTKLYAPFSGYISDVMFDEGELVNHGTPIASLINISSFKVDINVPAELYIKRDRITDINCTQEDIPNRIFPLVASGFNKKANNNGLYKLYLYYNPEGDTQLAPGMNVSVHVTYKAQDTTVTSIPASAVFERNSKSYVWLVNDSLVHARQIITSGVLNNGNINIKSGLNPGDEVVKGGLNLLKENEKVRIVAPESKTNIGNLL